MKTVKKLFLATTSLCFILSCSKEANKTFEAEFTGEYINVFTGDSVVNCNEKYTCRVVVNYKGTSELLGDFTGTFNFCACGPNDEYDADLSKMIFAKGDTLFVSCKGTVVGGKLPDHPDYVTSYWRDDFVILGGTGRFEGASGSGKTDDYNSSQDTNSHHHWKGTITLAKGKK